MPPAVKLRECNALTFDKSFSNKFDAFFMNTSRSQAKQLKDYENAVIAKRLEELDDDEIQALVEEIERDEF